MPAKLVFKITTDQEYAPKKNSTLQTKIKLKFVNNKKKSVIILLIENVYHPKRNLNLKILNGIYCSKQCNSFFILVNFHLNPIIRNN